MKMIHLPHFQEEEAVNFSVRDAELGAVAEFIHRVTEAEILIPASRLRSYVSVQLEKVPFSDALKEVGLALGPPPARAS